MLLKEVLYRKFHGGPAGDPCSTNGALLIRISKINYSLRLKQDLEGI